MDSSAVEANGSGIVCGGVYKSSSLEHLDSKVMNNIYTCVCDRKAILRNSAKLKSQIHSEINDLIETLKERERQLFLEIDEHAIDECEYLLSVAESFHPAEKNSIGHLSEVKSTSSCNGGDSKVHSTTFLKKKMEFITNPGFLKTLLQRFGHLAKVEMANENWGHMLGNVTEATEVKESASPRRDKFQHCVQEQMKKIFRKYQSKRVSKESSGSVESFEVIDKPEHNEYQKYSESLQDEDDIEIVSSPDESKPRQPVSFIPHIHKVFEVQSEEKLSPGQDNKAPPQSPDVETIYDPVRLIYDQINCMFKPLEHVDNGTAMGNLMRGVDESLDKEKDQPLPLDVHINPLEVSGYSAQSSSNQSDWPTILEPNERSESNGFAALLSKKTPEPRAVIQKTLNMYLDQDNLDMWLATSDIGSHSKVRSDELMFQCPRRSLFNR